MSRLSASATRIRHRVTESWRTSVQVRVIGSILAATSAVVLILGLTMISIVAQRLVDAKLSIATSEIDRARVTVEQQIAATDTSNSLQVRLNSARAALTNRSASSAADSTAVFEPVVAVTNKDGSVTTSPEGYRIPAPLRQFVAKDQISYQYSTITRPDHSRYKALIIGSPTQSDIPGLQVYLVLPLESEESTLALMRGLLAGGGVVLTLLLVGISWLLTNQVTIPVRSASRIAERFASGHLRERMQVNGEDEMARLAISFNAMAESLSKQIHQLEEYGNLQRQFTSDVSHELRTPLTTVRMAADMIADRKDELDAPAARASELMISELDHFEALLADLLEISRHDAGVAELSEESLDIRACVAAAWRSVSHLAAELDVPVIFYVPDDPVTMIGDSRRIERVLRNVLANAIDHSESRPVEVHLAGDDEVVAITVTDHGVGLKKGQEELVFNRFWRADPSRKRHSGGTGLGLAISREDALLHGGDLDAIGCPGCGSVFRLTLPRTPGQRWDHSPLPLTVPPPWDEALAGATPAIEAASAGTTVGEGSVLVKPPAKDTGDDTGSSTGDGDETTTPADIDRGEHLIAAPLVLRDTPGADDYQQAAPVVIDYYPQVVTTAPSSRDLDAETPNPTHPPGDNSDGAVENPCDDRTDATIIADDTIEGQP